MIKLELSAEECALLGEALVGRSTVYDTAADEFPDVAGTLRSKAAAFRILHVKIINARVGHSKQV